MHRRGFTLVELVTSLFISSVVVVAMASSIGLMSRALPDASKPTQTGMVVQRGLDVIALDVRFATDITIVGPGELSLQVADRDGDAIEDVITYLWDGAAGDPLTREHKSLGEAPVIRAVDSVVFEWASVTGTAEPSHKSLVVTVRVGTTEMTATQRCLNLEAD